MQGFDISGLAWVLSLCAVFVAAFIRGISGFGFALILAPVLLLLLNSKSVVVVNLFLGIITNIIVVAYTIRRLDLKRILPMTVAGLLGIPLGTWIIVFIQPSTLKILVGGVIIFFAAPMAIGFTRPFKKETAAGGVSGFISGILVSSTSLGGPPVVLFMHNQKWLKEDIYQAQAAYFLITNIFALAALYVSGLVDTQVIVFSTSLTPALLVGMFLGIVAFRKIDQRAFRILSLVIVIGAGILGVLSGLGLINPS
jgi:uncharacterized membrane protein YfcA